MCIGANHSCGHRKYHFFLSKPKSGVSIVTAITPAGLHHVFCIGANRAESSYVTKFRRHYQMDLLGQIPERKLLRTTPSPTQTLPSQLFVLCYYADLVPREPRVGLLLKVRPLDASNCDFSLCLCALEGK